MSSDWDFLIPGSFTGGSHRSAMTTLSSVAPTDITDYMIPAPLHELRPGTSLPADQKARPVEVRAFQCLQSNAWITISSSNAQVFRITQSGSKEGIRSQRSMCVSALGDCRVATRTRSKPTSPGESSEGSSAVVTSVLCFIRTPIWSVEK